jgi:hypothetical protein
MGSPDSIVYVGEAEVPDDRRRASRDGTRHALVLQGNMTPAWLRPACRVAPFSVEK